MLGDLVAKYESGNAGYDAIGNIPGDPGGASYGRYQLASKVGTLQAFLKASKYYTAFAGLKPGSLSFNDKWRALCKTKEFCDAQFNFIKITHFDPVQKYWISHHDMAVDNAINEALWSMSVQHSYSGSCRIIDAAEQHIPADYFTDDAITALYNARSAYVSGLSLPDKIKIALHNRYKNEMHDVLQIED